MKLADERVAAGLKRADPHHALGFAGDYLLDLHRLALEFLRGGVVVDHRDLETLVGRHLDLARREAVVLDRNAVVLRAGGARRGGDEGHEAHED